MPQTRTVGYSPDAEWLEADGLGGFASGTVGGARTRRYHALLLAATTPPTGRIVLVNGIEAWLETARPAASRLSSQRYAPDVIHPDGARRVAAFRPEPWPTWTFRCEDGTEVGAGGRRRSTGAPEVVLRWRLDGRRGPAPAVGAAAALGPRLPRACTTRTRRFRFDAEVAGEPRSRWRPYHGVPASPRWPTAATAHDPAWYRSSSTPRSARAASTASRTWRRRASSPSTSRRATRSWSCAPARPEPGAASRRVAGRGHLEAEARPPRAASRSPLHRAADAYIVRRGDGQDDRRRLSLVHRLGPRHLHRAARPCLATGRLEPTRGDPAATGPGRVSRGHAAQPLPRPGERAGVQLGRRVALVRGRRARLPGGGAPAGVRVRGRATGACCERAVAAIIDGLPAGHALRHPRRRATACWPPASRACSSPGWTPRSATGW